MNYTALARDCIGLTFGFLYKIFTKECLSHSPFDIPSAREIQAGILPVSPPARPDFYLVLFLLQTVGVKDFSVSFCQTASISRLYSILIYFPCSGIRTTPSSFSKRVASEEVNHVMSDRMCRTDYPYCPSIIGIRQGNITMGIITIIPNMGRKSQNRNPSLYSPYSKWHYQKRQSGRCCVLEENTILPDIRCIKRKNNRQVPTSYNNKKKENNKKNRYLGIRKTDTKQVGQVPNFDV